MRFSFLKFDEVKVRIVQSISLNKLLLYKNEQFFKDFFCRLAENQSLKGRQQ